MTYIVLVTIILLCSPPTQVLNGDIPLKFGPKTFLLNALHYLYEASSKFFLKCSKFNLFCYPNIPHCSKFDPSNPLLKPEAKYLHWISSFPSFLKFDPLSPTDSTTRIYLIPSTSLHPHLPHHLNHNCLLHSLSISVQIFFKQFSKYGPSTLLKYKLD